MAINIAIQTGEFAQTLMEAYSPFGPNGNLFQQEKVSKGLLRKTETHFRLSPNGTAQMREKLDQLTTSDKYKNQEPTAVAQFIALQDLLDKFNRGYWIMKNNQPRFTLLN